MTPRAPPGRSTRATRARPAQGRASARRRRSPPRRPRRRAAGCPHLGLPAPRPPGTAQRAPTASGHPVPPRQPGRRARSAAESPRRCQPRGRALPSRREELASQAPAGRGRAVAVVLFGHRAERQPAGFAIGHELQRIAVPPAAPTALNPVEGRRRVSCRIKSTDLAGRGVFMTEAGQAVVSDGDWGAPRAKTVQWYDPAITAAATAPACRAWSSCVRSGTAGSARRRSRR